MLIDWLLKSRWLIIRHFGYLLAVPGLVILSLMILFWGIVRLLAFGNREEMILMACTLYEIWAGKDED